MALLRLLADYPSDDETTGKSSYYSYQRVTRAVTDDNELVIKHGSKVEIRIPLDEIETAHPGISEIARMNTLRDDAKLPIIFTFSRETANNRSVTTVNSQSLKQKELKDYLSKHTSGMSADAANWVTKLAKSLTHYEPQEQTQLYIISDIPEERTMGDVAKALPDFFDNLERIQKRQGTAIVVIAENEEAKVPEPVKRFLRNRIHHLTMDQLLEYGRDMRRAKNRARQQLRKLNAENGEKAKSVPSDNSWRADEVSVLKIPSTTYDVDQLLAYASGPSHALDDVPPKTQYHRPYSYYSASRIYAQRGGLVSVATNSNDTPLESCAIILGSGTHQNWQVAYRWASLIALSRKAGNPIVPDSVTHVILTGDKQTTQKQAENYVILGATILQDNRDKVKPREDTLLLTCPYLTPVESGTKIGIVDPQAIINDDEIVNKFTVLQEANNIYTMRETLGFSYVLMCCLENSGNDAILNEIVQPLQEILDTATTNSEFVPWTVRKNATPISILNSGLKLMPDQQLMQHTMTHRKAMQIAAQVMKPLAELFNIQTNPRENVISDDKIDALRDMIGSSIENKTLLAIGTYDAYHCDERTQS
jgi:hypothetical protein